MTNESNVVEFADRTKPKVDLQEVGRPGTQFFRGFLSTDEHVAELTGVAGILLLDKMRRSDGMVAAVLHGLKLPLRSAKWTVEPASDDPQDIAIARQIGEDLFEHMSMPWSDHLRQVLTYLDFGFYLCEKVWEVTDEGAPLVKVDPDGTETRDRGNTRVRLRKLAPRLQRTVFRWNQSDVGELESVTQNVYGGQNGASGTADIPADKLLYFANDKEGANWMGKSVLRPAYKHWFIKDQLYRIQAIAADRHGSGIPVMKMADGKDDKGNMDRAEAILQNVRVNEQGYVVEPNGYEFRLEGMGQGRMLDVTPMIQHHDRMISVSVLAQFLTLGGSDMGSFALSEDQSSLFLMVQRATGEYVCDIHNRFLIPEWVRYNWSGVTRFPKLTVSNVETRNADRAIAAMAEAVKDGLLTPGIDVENAARALAGIPLREDPEGIASTGGDEPTVDIPPANQPAPTPISGPPAPPLIPKAPATPPAPRTPTLIHTDRRRLHDEREHAAELERELAELRRDNDRRVAELQARHRSELAEIQRRLEAEHARETADVGEQLVALEQRIDQKFSDRLGEVLGAVRELATRKPTRVVTEKHFRFGKGPQGQPVIAGAREVTFEEDE